MLINQPASSEGSRSHDYCTSPQRPFGSGTGELNGEGAYGGGRGDLRPGKLGLYLFSLLKILNFRE